MAKRKNIYPLPPVTSIDVYSNDVRVKRTGDGGPGSCGRRSEITCFSRAARDRLAFVAANTSVIFTTMITLTYPRDYPDDGRICKGHLTEFLQWIRRKWDDPDYLWFLEFQKRGAPHYHILVARDRRPGDIEAVAETWYKIVGSGNPDHLAAGTQTAIVRKANGAKRYAVKYCYKMRQKKVPDGFTWPGRFYGYSRNVKPKPLARVEIDERSLRAILDGWKWAPAVDQTMYPVLFGAAGHVARVLERASIWVDFGPPI